ncbi:MAG TPA: S-layer homology domain-containing protein [Acidimicrobiia bacterium]|nr:S-layer homology domain-containing protein [Acidimicrobiia bacterium]
MVAEPRFARAQSRRRCKAGIVVGLACLGILSGYLPGIQPASAAQGELVRVSVSQNGAQADSSSTGGVVSGDGRYVFFTSKAGNLVPGDTNGRDDIFRFDRLTAQVQPVSVTAAGAFLSANHGLPVVSGDGRYVAFWSEGVFDPADTLRTADVILKDMATGEVERLTLAPDGSNKIGDDRFSANKPLAMSDDARWVVFQSDATNLVAGDTDDGQPDIYVRDRILGTTTLLSTESDGSPGPSSGLDGVVAGTGPEAVVGFRVLAPDRSGQMVIRHMESGAEHLVVGADPQRSRFLAVAAGGGRAIVGTGAGSIPDEYDVTTEGLTPLPDNVDWSSVASAAFSADLRFYVAPSPDSFTFRVVDRETDQFSELPRGIDGAGPDQAILATSVSDDGTAVAFSSAASNLVFGDTNALADSFVVRVAKGTFADDDGNPFEADIEWLAAEGITLGCGIELFCPKAPVTRGQMASFLVRSLDLPASATDAFTDDAASSHQADINALAEAGITTGCGPGVFCPEASVTRQQMASFLTRALDLPVSTTDFFTDDAGSIHEDDINALASRGITLGCAPGLFCPTAEVLREQMAAFLHRGFT